MVEKDLELPLSTYWLNDREQFDLRARNQAILKRFLKMVSAHDPLVIADIGSGTGNNALFLSGVINGNTVWYLVERELALLENSKRRIAERYRNSIRQEGDTLYVTDREKQITFHFLNETLESFLEREIDVSMMTCSALFDLFTKAEFERLFQLLEHRKIPLYAVLNYCGAAIIPESDRGIACISKFESHMSRKLAKGNPMGRDTMVTINEIVAKSELAFMESGESNWEIPSNEKRFLEQNFNFYKEAVLDLLTTESEKKDFLEWFALQHDHIQKGLVELKVYHQDFLIGHADL